MIKNNPCDRGPLQMTLNWIEKDIFIKIFSSLLSSFRCAIGLVNLLVLTSHCSGSIGTCTFMKLNSDIHKTRHIVFMNLKYSRIFKIWCTKVQSLYLIVIWKSTEGSVYNC